MPKGPLNYRRQQRAAGAFVKIQIDKEYHTYARILTDASFAFYDIKKAEDIDDLEWIAAQPVLFVVAVYNDAVTKGRWPKIGKLPLEDRLMRHPPQFIQDPINLNFFSIYDNGEIRPSTRAECEGLERCAVWEPEHVESRIRDHYAGVPNSIVERMRIREPEKAPKDNK